MKAFLILIVFFSFAAATFGQDYPDSGFTNKAEAKNLTINGLKEGKWVEYEGIDRIVIPTDTSAELYNLSVYKAGKRIGLSRCYYKNGILNDITPYSNGLRNGVEKAYYENGVLATEITYKNDSANGEEKSYYENGALMKIIEDHLVGHTHVSTEKWYYENGKLKKEIETTSNRDGLKIASKEYYEDGKLESVYTSADSVQSDKKKAYYENGKLKSETIWNNNTWETTNYDSTGHEIK